MRTGIADELLQHPVRMALVALWCSLIFALSGQAGSASAGLSRWVCEQIAAGLLMLPGLAAHLPGMEALVDLLHHGVRKAAHMTEFGVLALLVLNWLVTAFPLARAAALSLVFTVLYAAGDETHQLFVPARAGTLSDVCIDSCGALLGLGAGRLFFLCRKGIP